MWFLPPMRPKYTSRPSRVRRSSRFWWAQFWIDVVPVLCTPM